MTGTETKQSVSSVFLGPWGGEDGEEWYYTATGAITRILITSDNDAIRSIRFVSGDKSPEFGTPAGPAIEINIDPDVERLILMEGIVCTYDFANDLVDDFVEKVTQLSFTTSKNGVTTKHGPYGSKQKGIEFSCLLTENSIAGFHGRCSELLNSIGVMVRTSDDFQSWGGKGGSPWSYTPKGTISHIHVSHGDVISAIRFTSIDESGNEEHSQTFGNSDPKHKHNEIKINTEVEKLNGIIGTYGTYGKLTVIRSLAFTTNDRKTFGTFGTRTGIPFKYSVNNDEEVIYGFSGQAGSLIDAIGVCTKSTRISTNGIFVGPAGNGENKWEYQPKGRISRIILTSIWDPYFNTIAFESKDEHGSIDQSPVFGNIFTGATSVTTHEINIEGKLNGVGGTVRALTDITMINSLYFSTDEGITYGPFGDESIGTHFSIPVKQGFISGFHGTNPINPGYYYLQSLGVYVNHM